jgi:hypothetical protein
MDPQFNFIDYFLQYTAAAESPTDFFKWAAVSAISAIARDNIYLETEVITVYPNLYVLLYAKSGACKKSVPLKKIRPIIEAVKNTKVIKGRTSLQFAISNLALGVVNGAGEVIAGASGLIYTEELTSMIIRDESTIDYLTDLYDYHQEWSSGTHARGEEKLSNVCLSILAATNEKLFKQVFNAEAIYGGLLGRTLIVQGHSARHKNSLMYKTVEELSDKPMISHLVKLSRLKGPMTLTEEASAYFHKWYMEQDFEKFDSETGLESRLTAHMLKVSICLAMAEEALLKVIRLDHLKTAMDMVLKLIPSYRMLSTNVMVSEEQKQSVLIMKAILKLGGKWIERKELLRAHWFELDMNLFPQIIEKLIAGNMIESGYENGNEIVYKASDRAIDQFVTRVQIKAMKNGTGH